MFNLQFDDFTPPIKVLHPLSGCDRAEAQAGDNHWQELCIKETVVADFVQ